MSAFHLLVGACQDYRHMTYYIQLLHGFCQVHYLVGQIPIPDKHKLKELMITNPAKNRTVHNHDLPVCYACTRVHKHHRNKQLLSDEA